MDGGLSTVGDEHSSGVDNIGETLALAVKRPFRVLRVLIVGLIITGQ